MMPESTINASKLTALACCDFLSFGNAVWLSTRGFELLSFRICLFTRGVELDVSVIEALIFLDGHATEGLFTIQPIIPISSSRFKLAKVSASV